MAEISLTKLKEYYYSQIDMDDLGTVDDVNRLVNLIGLHRKYRKDINQRGVMPEYKNGGQTYEKENPSSKSIQSLQDVIKKLKNSIDWQTPESAAHFDDVINDEELI